MSKTTGTATQAFVWDVADDHPRVLKDGTNTYIYGPGGLPIEHVDASGAVVYYHHDQLGSTRVLTDATATVAATTTYDPYGRPTASTGSTTTPLGYAGEYTDAETGLQYLRARYYDPATGQFLTRDPMEAITRSAYGYVDGNPLNWVDSDGLSPRQPRTGPSLRKPTPEIRKEWDAAEGEAPSYPETPGGMDDLTGTKGKPVPDGPNTPGRGKVVWELPDGTKITYEQHPYHPNAPGWHRDPHWHIDQPCEKPHQRRLPGDPFP